MSSVARYLDPNLIQRLNQLQLSARRVVVGSTIGSHRSPVKGASIEFRQHRFYVPGDEPRRLDWRVFGRTDRPYIKEYDEETNLRCVLMLDCSGSMGYGRQFGSKFEYAGQLVASLAYLMLGSTESVGLALYRRRVERWLAPHAGTSQLSSLIEALERSAPRGLADPSAAMRDVAMRLERRALIIIISDHFSPVEAISEGLSRLKHDRHELIVMQVLDPDEAEFPFGRWVRLRGMEGEPSRLVEPAVARQTYIENFQRHGRQLRDACGVVHAEFATMMIDRPLIDTLTSFLQRRETAVRGGTR